MPNPPVDYETRIAQLMATHNITREQAVANQASAVQQGADFNYDNVVTGAEWQRHLRGENTNDPNTLQTPASQPYTGRESQQEYNAAWEAFAPTNNNSPAVWNTGGYTIPNWVPPVTSAGDLNTQKLQSEIVKTVAGDATVIPVAYGKVQLPGRVVALVYDDVTDANLPVWTVAVLWCWGECEAIDATFLNGAAATGGVTVENHLGTTTQLKSTLMTAAKLVMGVTYADTLVIDDDRGTVGLCYSVFQFDDEEYETWPEFIAEISGRKVFDPREGSHVFGTPSTWEFTETPALMWRDWVTSTMFGPGEAVDDAEVEVVADDNDATVTTEVRRNCGMVIDTRQRWETWRKIFETYSSAWGYKRGTEWILKSDRPRTSDFTLNDDSFVEGSFSVSIAPLDTIPTLVRVWYTDKTDPIWRERSVEAELAGVSGGTVERRTSEIKLPGVTRDTQALREATERLQKLNRYLQIEGTLLDDHIGIEPGDVITVTHKLGISAVEFRVIPSPGFPQAGRTTIRAIRYSSADYSDLETSTVVLAEDRFTGQVGGSGTGALALLDTVTLGTNVDDSNGNNVGDVAVLNSHGPQVQNFFVDGTFGRSAALGLDIWEAANPFFGTRSTPDTYTGMSIDDTDGGSTYLEYDFTTMVDGQVINLSSFSASPMRGTVKVSFEAKVDSLTGLDPFDFSIQYAARVAGATYATGVAGVSFDGTGTTLDENDITASWATYTFSTSTLPSSNVFVECACEFIMTNSTLTTGKFRVRNMRMYFLEE